MSKTTISNTGDVPVLGDKDRRELEVRVLIILENGSGDTGGRGATIGLLKRVPQEPPSDTTERVTNGHVGELAVVSGTGRRERIPRLEGVRPHVKTGLIRSRIAEKVRVDESKVVGVRIETNGVLVNEAGGLDGIPAGRRVASATLDSRTLDRHDILGNSRVKVGGVVGPLRRLSLVAKSEEEGHDGVG